MPATPIDRTRDTLLTPLLEFLQAAINADLNEVMIDEAGESQPAVASVLIRPQALDQDPDGARLSCYRLRTRSKRVSFGHVDHVSTLQFDYVTPSCGAEQLDDRWPILQRVWGSLVRAMSDGSHEAYNEGQESLSRCGIIFVDISSAQKVEIYADGEVAFPAFRGSIDVTWRDGYAVDTADMYPALSWTNLVYADGVEAPSAVSVSYTDAGLVERDADTIEETGEAVL